MKLRLLAALLLLGVLCPAASPATGRKATLKGVLVDIACATERGNDLTTLGIKHTRKCLQMPECDKSGFGLLTADNKVIRFDAAGNELARKLIGATERETGWRVKVSGRVTADAMTVRKLAFTE